MGKVVLATLIPRRPPCHLVHCSLRRTWLLYLQDVRKCFVHAHWRFCIAGIPLSLLGFDFWSDEGDFSVLLGDGHETAESQS